MHIKKPIKFEDIISEETDNIAELLSEEDLNCIGDYVVSDFELDEDSRSEWRERVEKAMKIAQQTEETKSYPWTGAANVQYPLITRSSIEFAARTYGEVIRNDRVVKIRIIGADREGEEDARAKRVAKFMNYELIHSSVDWEDDTDALLHMLPIMGVAFRKVYADPKTGMPRTKLCSALDVVINDNIKTLEQAPRISYIKSMTANELISERRRGRFLELDIANVKHEVNPNLINLNEDSPTEPSEETDKTANIIEQHRTLDLDGDGYAEPYIVVVHQNTRKVLRIGRNFDPATVEVNREGEIVSIEKTGDYWIDYHFLPSPDGGFYSLGLGHLLYPINNAINTLINQLIDAGTLNNSQSGFFGRGLRMKQGDMEFELGQWKPIDTVPGQTIKENIVPLPTKEPSPTLFSLLGLLIEAGKDLSTVQDVMQGKGPVQNVPATSVLTLNENGLKVFNTIQKRLHRSLKKEFKTLYRWYARSLTAEYYSEVLNEVVYDGQLDLSKEDFNLSKISLTPVSDPMNSTDAQRVAKAQMLLALPGGNQSEKHKYALEAMQFEEYEVERFATPAPPEQPDPKMLEIQLKAKELEHRMQADNAKLQLEAIRAQADKDRTETGKYTAAAQIANMQQDNIRQQQHTEAKVRESDAKITEGKAKQAKDMFDSLVKEEEMKLKAKLDAKRTTTS